MIVVDTSALMAILLNEADADTCAAALEGAGRLLISSGTVAESLIVAQRRGVGDEMEQLLSGLGFEVMAVTAADARRVAEAYQNWGKGLHPAGLNFGDCFAYALAKEQACPLLYVGNAFARTDIHSSLPA